MAVRERDSVVYGAEVIWSREPDGPAPTLELGRVGFMTQTDEGPEHYDFESEPDRLANEANPEVMLATAHASCFVQALGSVIDQQQHDAHHLHVRSACVMEREKDGGVGWRIKELHVDVVADVRDPIDLRSIVREAERICPISKAFAQPMNVVVHQRLGAEPEYATGSGTAPTEEDYPAT